MNTKIKEKMKMLVFDFDGVICDSFEEIILTLNSIANGGKIKNLSKLELNKLRQIETKEVFSLLGIRNEQLSPIITETLKILSSKIASLKLIQGVEKVLHALHKSEIPLGIVTSNSKENVSLFLETHHINFFDFIHTSNLFDKGTTLKRLIQNMACDPKDIFYIGDETRDIIASREASVHSVAVGWGFNHRNVLIRHKPDYLLTYPSELIKLIS